MSEENRYSKRFKTFMEEYRHIQKWGWLSRWQCWIRGHKWNCITMTPGREGTPSGPCRRCGIRDKAELQNIEDDARKEQLKNFDNSLRYMYLRSLLEFVPWEDGKASAVTKPVFSSVPKSVQDIDEMIDKLADESMERMCCRGGHAVG